MKDKNTLGKFYERFCFHFFSFSSLGSSKESYPVIRFLKHTTLCRNGVIIILRYEHLMQHRYYMNSVSCHFTSNKLLNEKRNTVERRKKLCIETTSHDLLVTKRNAKIKLFFVVSVLL